MRKTSGMVKAVPVVLLSLFLLTSCGPKDYNGFKLTKQSGARCVELPSPSQDGSVINIPLSYYQVSEAYIKNIVSIYNAFNLESEDTFDFYENAAAMLVNFDTKLLLEDDKRSFDKWKSASSGKNVKDAKPFAKETAAAIKTLVSVIKKLSRQDPLLNKSFASEDFFSENGKTKEVQNAASFIAQFYPGVKVISDFSERTPFVIDESKYIDFPLAASVNKEGEATLIVPDGGKLATFKMPVLFYEKLRSIAQKMANYYNKFSETDRQVVTELFEGCSELHLLNYNLLDFFPTDSDRKVLLDWLRYIVSLRRDDAMFLTGGLASYCRAQWLYSYEIISVLDDINWNCDNYDDKEAAIKRAWNDNVYKNQDLMDALVFFEESFPDLKFIRNLD